MAERVQYISGIFKKYWLLQKVSAEYPRAKKYWTYHGAERAANRLSSTENHEFVILEAVFSVKPDPKIAGKYEKIIKLIHEQENKSTKEN